MGAKSGLALKFTQWFLRGVQFLCAALILGVYSYFLAALHNHNLSVPTSVRAVEGISGAAVLYSLIGLVLLCCLAGIAFTSFIAILLDIAFIGAFIYVAIANKNGASSCQGYVDTPFGKGQAGKTAQGSDGFTNLPSFHTACKLQTAVLAVSIVAIIFFILSILTELALVRHHRKEKRFGPSPKNNYTSGYAKKGGIFSRIFKRRGAKAPADDETGLPQHPAPNHLNDGRQSYATETTAVNNHPVGQAIGPENGYKNNYPHEMAQPQPQHNGVDYGHGAHAQPQPANYRYNDGVYDPVAR